VKKPVKKPQKKPMSLTLRLFLSIATLNILAMGFVAILGLHSANNKIAEEYDAQLITEASVLWQIMHEDVREGNFEEYNIGSETPLLEKIQVESLLKYAQWRAFRVWKDDKAVIRSDNTDTMPTSPTAAGFSEVTIAGETWRIFSMHVPDEGIVVETFENLHNRELLQKDILFGVVGPLTVMLPLLGLLFSFGIGFGLKSLHKLARRLSTRSPADLSRLPSNDIPPELKPLANAVNTLLAKLETSIIHEREFIDHAAHELRTPLSALKLQAQILAKSLQDPMLVDELLTGVDRTSKLVDQLLLLSRVAQQDIQLERIDLYNVVKEAIGMHALRIVDKNLTLDLSGDENATTHTQPELLRTLISTLLDNAIKYPPKGGDIAVTVTQKSITITDTGPGIPEAERPHVFDRFYRISGTKQPGSGLGLAIASQIAGQLNATIRLETPESHAGLRVVIILASS
jgi:two-component system sensor histidine kinase QseC